MIKKDAVINVKIGTGFLKKIQDILIEMTSSRTEEEMDVFKTCLENKTAFPESWMENAYTLILLIRSIEEESISQGLTYEEDITNVIKQLDN